ncbi:MAG: hypothetical protein LH629_14020 [Ignavibacteria bacterium]|nr:hypothetical protein [Ignavibacteria bacterium]
MQQLIKESSLTQEERGLFEYHSDEIQSGIRQGQSARNQVISNVLAVLESNPPLWRENYLSEEDYVKTELNIEMSSFWRNVKNNKNYLHLIANTEDINEQITLTRMRDAAYRELRRIATTNESLLRQGNESEETYQTRLRIKDQSDAESVEQLWQGIYPKIVKFKEQSQTGIYPNGGYSVTAKDITETCAILLKVMEIPKLLNQGFLPSQIPIGSLEGRDISLQETMDANNDYAMEVIEAVQQLGVSESLSEKLFRQSSHIKESLEKKYDYDKYEGRLIYEDGVLQIVNAYHKYNLLQEWSDLLGRETQISVRRQKNLLD